ISPADSGIWSDAHAKSFARITKFIREQGAVPAIQLAHAGRKASTNLPWLGHEPLGPERGGWQTIAPSPIPFDDGYAIPREMSADDIDASVVHFSDATVYSLHGGFEVVEIHMAHGYLLNEFLSPLSNHRRDEYGG